MATNRKPILIIDNSRWAQSPAVVFEDDPIIGYHIPLDWIEGAYNRAIDEADEDETANITREGIAADLEVDFLNENSEIDAYWPQYGVCQTTGDCFYRYMDNGEAIHISFERAMELMPDVADQYLKAWEAEQAAIASSEVITPRNAGIINHFGIDPDEQDKLADDETILRRYNGKLFVFEAQLDEPAQWRLLQPRPHMPTGTLPFVFTKK